MARQKKSNWGNLEPQKSSAAQYLTYIASYGITNEKFEICYENVENVTTAIAQDHAEAEYEKYRLLQDKLFMSDYDRYLLALEEEAKKGVK